MTGTCLFCHERLPANETLEHFRTGRRVAFDPRRGRLWAVCPSCARWTLAPFETRWEALEELERLTRDRARLLAETDNIGLLETGDIEIVRVGSAGLREESWWRFGKEFAARRKRARRQVLKGKVVDGGVFMLITGIPFWGFSDADKWLDRARRRRFGKRVWEAPPPCDRCGRALKHIPFADYGRLVLHPGDDGPVLALPCDRCARDGADRHHRLTGPHAEHVLRRTLAYRNFAGGTEPLVDDAVALVEAYDTTGALVRGVADYRPTIGGLTEKGALALEIALNDDVERRLLAMEVAELEARWKVEEEIAAIADSL